MDAGLKQWIVMGVSIAVSFIPVAGPLISCIIDGTFVDMLTAISNGDWAMVGVYALGFVGGGVAALKAMKVLGGTGKATKATKYSRYMSETEMLAVKRTGTMKSLSSHGTHIASPGAPRTAIASKAQKMHGLGGKPDYRVDFNIVNDNSIRRVTPAGASTWPQECIHPGDTILVSDVNVVKMNKWLPSWWPG